MSRTGKSCRTNDGYTLTELMVVMTILTVLAGTMPSVVTAVLPSARLRTSVSETITFLEHARQHSSVSGESVNVTIASGTKGVTLQADHQQRPLSISRGINLDYQPQFSEKTQTEIHFYADGTSSGGTLTFDSKVGTETLTLHWLTGHVSREYKNE